MALKKVFRPTVIAGSLFGLLSCFSPISCTSRFGQLLAADISPKKQCWMDMKYDKVVRQQYTFSCGLASLASVMTSLGDIVTENELVDIMKASFSEAEIQQILQQGLNPREIEQLIATINITHKHNNKTYLWKQYKNLTMDDLQVLHNKIGDSVIVFLTVRGANHYAIYVGEQGTKIHLRDSIRGNVYMPKWQLLEEWHGGVLALVRLDSAEVMTKKEKGEIP